MERRKRSQWSNLCLDGISGEAEGERQRRVPTDALEAVVLRGAHLRVVRAVACRSDETTRAKRLEHGEELNDSC